MARYAATANFPMTSDGTQHRSAFPGTIMMGGLAGFVKDAVQGVCSGAMTLFGILNTIGAETATLLPSFPLEQMVGSFLNSMQIGEFASSEFAGPVQIAIGAALFFTARRGMARTLGLLGFILYISALVGGYDFNQIGTMAGHFGESIKAGWVHFQDLQTTAAP